MHIMQQKLVISVINFFLLFLRFANQMVRFHLKCWNEFKFIRLKFVTDAHIKRFPVCKLQFVWWLLILTKTKCFVLRNIAAVREEVKKKQQQQNKTQKPTTK